MSIRKKVLFVTPVLPNVDGGGPEKRAHQWVTLLEKQFDVHLLLVSTGPLGQMEPISNKVKHLQLNYGRWYRKVNLVKTIVSLIIGKKLNSGTTALGWLPLRAPDKLKLNAYFENASFEKIICFRSFCSEFALYIARISSYRTIELDTDDLESETRIKLSKIYFRTKKYQRALKYRLAAAQFASNEHLMSSFDKVFLCSDLDRQRLASRMPKLNIEVLPNRIYVKHRSNLTKVHSRTILFVGSLNYYPNEHAILWFIENVFQKLKASNDNWRFNVVGYAASERLKTRLKVNGVDLRSNLKDIGDAYNSNSFVVAPIFAGGGTKLKVLEAMSFKRPVIATKEAVTGLSLVDGQHYLHAETAEGFVKHCCLLASDNDQYRSITESAYHKVLESYSYSS
jgi:glycosyltransferase involved in cell wall biosynthesis